MKCKEEVWVFYQKYGKRFISSTLDYDKMLIPLSVIYVYTWTINQVKQLYMRRSTMSKKLFAILLTLVMLMGTTSSFAVADANATAQVNDQIAYNGNTYYNFGGPVDLNVADEDKVIEMLKKEGKIDPNASYEVAHAIFARYMQDAAKANQNEKPSKMERDLKAKQNQKVQKYKFDNQTTDMNPKNVNILVLLVEFSDYKHNMIQSGETAMYYADYSHQHYDDMIFGDNGYVGPNGENLISMKQYYAQQSGGSLQINGKVAGWYGLSNPAAYYGAHNGASNDIRPRNAVKEALKMAAQDPNINLADYDKEDIYDLDGDGNYNEPDGIVDYLMVLHASIGEEAGGGTLGSNAIWSHSWNLGGLYNIPGTSYYAYSYTIEPEDGATGVFAHEFGHNLGLPDEYDIDYSSATSEPVSYWSIMSSGSWAGAIPGTEPPGFSPYAKQYYQAVYGGNWQNSININYEELTAAGAKVTLRQANENGQVVRISLPDKITPFVTPAEGNFSYWSSKGDGIDHSMYAAVNIPAAANAQLKFKTWYQIEEHYDYASVIVREEGTSAWTTIAGNITTTDSPYEQNPGNGITGASNAWVDASFDLTGFAGKKVEIGFNYWTDGGVAEAGILVDDIVISADGNTILADNGETTSTFTFEGFEKNDGTFKTNQYYLVELRSHNGVDQGLAHISTAGQVFSYNPGMLVWFVDDSISDNCTGYHPGEGYLSVVDADQNNMLWTYDNASVQPLTASNKYQMRDAAFSKDKEAPFSVAVNDAKGLRTVMDTSYLTEPSFNSNNDYSNPMIPTIGVKLPNYGIKIQITNQAKDNSSMSITIKK